MLHLCYVLEFIIDGFDNGPFPEESLSERNIYAPFIAFQLGYKLYAVHEQSLKKIPADISFIADKLSVDEFHKGLVFKRFTVIHVTRGNHEIQEFSAFVAYKMKFESEEPNH